MSNKNAFRVSTAAADIYERQNIPAVFGPSARAALEVSTPKGSASVLDAACGTGVISRLLCDRLAEPSRIVGTGLNPAMLEVAGREAPRSHHTVEWFVADVVKLPFDDE